MMKFFKWFFGLFSPYVHPFERKVDKFFKGIKSTDSISSVRGRLLKLMQKNLLVVNVWMEKKFKGYKYLTKGARRKMYEDAEIIKKKLKEYSAAHPADLSIVKNLVSEAGCKFPQGQKEQMLYLYEIMQFLKPGLYFKYIKTASFGKLLRNPNNMKLEGDCNQIVTLYIYLFSLKFPLQELSIKLLPEHVCLHFRGVDIEATNATFQHYSENLEVLPVTEIISTNLLDLSDFREDVQVISEREMVKSAQLAYALSSLKSLVAKNLNIAYRNMGIAAMKSNNFDSAVFYFEKVGDRDLILSAYHNAAVYFMKIKDFKKAKFYASKSGKNDLENVVMHNQAVSYYQKGRIDAALKLFKSLGDDEMVKACLGKQFNELRKKVAHVKTVARAKKHRYTYLKMLDLAKEMGDSELEKNIKNTLDQM